MKIRKIINVLVVSLSFTFFACQQENVKIDTTGEIPVKLSMEGDFTVNTQSKSEDSPEETPWVNPDNYSIQILRNVSSKWEPYAGFNTYSELPENKTLRFQYGEYQFKSWWGKNNVAAFDAPFYYGETVVKVDADAINAEGYIPVMMTPSLANTKLKINFTREFQHAFRQYVYIGVQIYTAESKDKPLVYAVDETRDAYLRPAAIYLKLSLKKLDGTRYSYGLCTIEDVKAKDFFTVNLTAETDPSSATFNVTVTEATNRVAITEAVPFSAIVKEEPKIKLSFVSPFETVCKLQLNQNPKLAAIDTNAGLKELVLNHNIEEFTAAEVPSGSSLLDPTIIERLKTLGVDVHAEMENTISTVAFTELLNKVELNGAENRVLDLGIVATDLSGKVIAKDFSFKVKPVQFEIPEILQTDIWTKEVIVHPATLISTDANPEKFASDMQYAFSTDNGANWTPFAIPLGQKEYAIKGLTPNSKCQIRYSYPEISETTKEVTTYPVIALANGTLDAYSSAKTSGSKDRAKIYNYTINDWANSNAITLSPNKKHNYNNWPSVEPSDGGMVVQSIAYGGNTMVSTGNVIDKVSAGALFLGSMNGQDPIEGINFNSRPTHITYQYKFKKVNNKAHCVQIKIEHRALDGSVYTLGEGVYNGTDENTTSWTNNKIEILYKPEFGALTPTHICLAFISARIDPSEAYTTVSKASLDLETDKKNNVEHYWGSIGAVTWPLDEGYLDSKYIGSRLWINNIALVYEK